jgi:uncharacterized damage-inducible protein DinB
MMTLRFTDLLDETLEAWSDCRTGLIEEAENIPADRFDFRPHPQSRSVSELLRHVVETALMWSGELARTDGDFRRQPFSGFIREYAGHVAGVDGRDELLDLLRGSHRDGEHRLREVGELHMLQFIHRFDGRPGTRLAWLGHGIAHEMYHRGQLAQYARIMGLVPALTRRIGA